MQKYLLLLLVVLLLPNKSSQRKYTYKSWANIRSANWSSLIYQPAAYVTKSHVRLRNRLDGYKPGSWCAKYVGVAYLDHILESRQTICSAAPATSQRRLNGMLPGRRGRDLFGEEVLSPFQSSVDCYTAPYIPVGSSNKATISLCRSRNMVLNTCAFLSGKRKGTLAKKFPLPAPGSVQLACDMEDVRKRAEGDSGLHFLKSIHHEVWWANATRNDEAVAAACAPNSTNLVTTPTLFVMRDRHANYAHEMEVVSMAFSFLAALEPTDIAEQGVQVVIVDQAPPTGFLETWARISHPHRLRILAQNPYPPGTCFRSAYHVYTFAAGIGYNTNGETIHCESPVVTGLSHWLRELYEERDPWATTDRNATSTTAAAAGPYAAAAGVRGLRPPTAGIIMKNVVWLSRRNLELVRLLLNASVGWKAMRMVRNEDEVVAAILAAVQEWNAESCLLKEFDRVVEEEYRKSLTTVHAVHMGDAEAAVSAKAKLRRRTAEEDRPSVAAPARVQGMQASKQAKDHELGSAAAADAGTRAKVKETEGGTALRRLLEEQDGSDIDEHGNDGVDDDDNGHRGQGGISGAVPTLAVAASGSGGGSSTSSSSSSNNSISGGTKGGQTEATAAANNIAAATPRKTAGGLFTSSNTILLNQLWETNPNFRDCRRSNVLFTFVDGDFNDMPYHQQLKIIFRSGVLVGVHGAGLTHGFFMPPGQSAVLQLLGESFAKVAANNVFRNMARGVGNFYEDVLYSGVDVKVDVLKAAVKRAMDFVAQSVMDAQLRQNRGEIPLMLDDQSHFSVVMPSPEHCPSNRTS